MNQRPSEEEYAGDFGEYIQLVPDGNIIDILLAQEKQMTEMLASLTESHGAYRYAEGKWTLKEVVGHIADGERVMTYRLLRFARGDQTPLSGFDQELFVPPFGSWTTAQLAEDYRAVRHRRTRDSSHGGHPKSVFELVVRKIGTEAARKTRLPFFLYGSLPAPFVD